MIGDNRSMWAFLAATLIGLLFAAQWVLASAAVGRPHRRAGVVDLVVADQDHVSVTAAERSHPVVTTGQRCSVVEAISQRVIFENSLARRTAFHEIWYTRLRRAGGIDFNQALAAIMTTT